MTPIEDLKKLLQHASERIEQAMDQQTADNSELGEPAALSAAVDDLLDQFAALDAAHGSRALIPQHDLSSMGEEAMGYLEELGLIADHLQLPKESHAMDDLVLEVAHWLIRHHAEIRFLDPVVNALALKANRYQDPKILNALCHALRDVVEHTAAEIKSDPDKTDLARPWRMLNFNYAIIATRTQQRELMEQAFDTLGRNLPEDCPQFFAEGLRQSVQPEYGPEIKEIMSEYLHKWVVRH